MQPLERVTSQIFTTFPNTAPLIQIENFLYILNEKFLAFIVKYLQKCKKKKKTDLYNSIQLGGTTKSLPKALLHIYIVIF